MSKALDAPPAEGRLVKIGRCRRPKNEAEGKFFDAAFAAGWRASKRGWPDFFLTRDDGSIACVEVKADARHPLKREQRQVMEALSSYGVPCFRWDPETGFQRIGPGGAA